MYGSAILGGNVVKSMFGVVPELVTYAGRRKRYLPLVLDTLHLSIINLIRNCRR